MSKKSKQRPQPITPMQKARKRIAKAYVFGLFSAAITLTLAFVSMTGIMTLEGTIYEGIGIYSIIDIIIMLLLSILIAAKKSRVSAIILFLYYVISELYVILEEPILGLIASVFVIIVSYSLFMGIIGTFSYHRIKKQEQDSPAFKENETEIIEERREGNLRV